MGEQNCFVIDFDFDFTTVLLLHNHTYITSTPERRNYTKLQTDMLSQSILDHINTINSGK